MHSYDIFDMPAPRDAITLAAERREAQAALEQAHSSKPVRACANCEQEQGILNRSDANKTHGVCRRHFIEFVRSAGFTDEQVAAEIKKVSRKGFCPDLSKGK